MTRRTHMMMLAAGFAACAPAAPGEEKTTMRELFETSQNDKKGVMIYVKGQAIGGVVTKTAGDFIELRSREYSKIVIRIDAIDAVAMS